MMRDVARGPQGDGDPNDTDPGDTPYEDLHPHEEDDGVNYAENEPVADDDGGTRQSLMQDALEAEFSVVQEKHGAPTSGALMLGTKREPLPDRAKEAEAMLVQLEQPDEAEQVVDTMPAVAGNAQQLPAVTSKPQVPLSLKTATDPKSLLQYGTLLYQSQVFPSVKSPQDAVARILMARSLQIDEMKAMYMLHPIDGKLVLSADLTRFLLDRAGVRWRIIHDRAKFINPSTSQDDYLTEIILVQGPAEKPTKKVTWRAWWSELHPFWSGKNRATWEKHPRAMQLHACMRQCARFYFPAILGGFYEAEELGASEADTFAQEV